MCLTTELQLKIAEEKELRGERHQLSVSILGVYLAVAIMLGGCVQRKDRSGLLKGVKTTRVRLTPKHTLSPDLQIDLPEGFMADWVKEAKYDKFYIYNQGDTGDVQRGMIILDISPTPTLGIVDSAKIERSVGKLGEFDVEWREALEKSDPKVKVYQREMVQRDALKKFRSTDGKGPLTLHALVVGSDSLLVEQLTASVETIKVLPATPNL